MKIPVSALGQASRRARHTVPRRGPGRPGTTTPKRPAGSGAGRSRTPARGGSVDGAAHVSPNLCSHKFFRLPVSTTAVSTTPVSAALGQARPRRNAAESESHPWPWAALPRAPPPTYDGGADVVQIAHPRLMLEPAAAAVPDVRAPGLSMAADGLTARTARRCAPQGAAALRSARSPGGSGRLCRPAVSRVQPLTANCPSASSASPRPPGDLVKTVSGRNRPRPPPPSGRAAAGDLAEAGP